MNAEESAALISKWQKQVKALDKAKKMEEELRKEVLALAKQLEPNLPDEGTSKIALDGKTLKVVTKLNRRIDEATLSDVRNKLPPDVFNAVFRFKPDLVTSGYRTLDDIQRKIVDSTLIIKPATPTITLE